MQRSLKTKRAWLKWLLPTFAVGVIFGTLLLSTFVHPGQAAAAGDPSPKHVSGCNGRSQFTYQSPFDGACIGADSFNGTYLQFVVKFSVATPDATVTFKNGNGNTTDSTSSSFSNSLAKDSGTNGKYWYMKKSTGAGIGYYVKHGMCDTGTASQKNSANITVAITNTATKQTDSIALNLCTASNDNGLIYVSSDAGGTKVGDVKTGTINANLVACRPSDFPSDAHDNNGPMPKEYKFNEAGVTAVTLTNTKTKVSKNIIDNGKDWFTLSNGSLSIPNLNPGTYNLQLIYLDEIALTSNGASYIQYAKQYTFTRTNLDITAGVNWVTAKSTANCSDMKVTDIGGNTSGTGSSDEQHDSNATCDTGGFGLNWIICPVYNTVADFSDWMFRNLVQPMLRTAPISTDPSDVSYKVWSSFRIYGNVFLVIALLVIVFGQSIGGGMIDAYTAKKVLPRLLIAAILINLSIYIVALAVDITNILGGGLGSLITAPLDGQGAFNISPSGAQAGLVVGGAGIVAGLGFVATALGAIPSLGFILLFLIMPVVLGLLAAFVTMILRKAIILALVLVSPVAFALYCLPNTEQYFKKWWDLLIKTLLVYPIIIVIFAVADVLAVTVMNANNKANPLALVISFVLQFLPLLLIPYAFKIAGGAIGRLHEVMTNYHKRGQEAVKGNVNDVNSLRNKMKRQYGEKVTRAQNQIVQSGRGTNASGFRQLRSNIAGRFGNVDARMANYNAEAAKRLEQLSNTGDDTLVYAGAGWQEADGTYRDSKGRVINKTTYDQGKRLYGDSQHSIAQALSYTLRKAQTDGDFGNFRQAFMQNAVQENWSNEEAQGVWAAATYPHKGSSASEWYSTPSVQKNASGRTSGVRFDDVSTSSKSYGKMIGDMHKTRTSFEQGRVRDIDWRAMHDHQVRMREKMDAGVELSSTEAKNYAMTSEVLTTMGREALMQQAHPDAEHNDQVSVSGVTAASQTIIEEAYKAEKASDYKVQVGPTLDHRQIVRDPKGGGGPVLVKGGIAVTGDLARSSSPK